MIKAWRERRGLQVASLLFPAGLWLSLFFLLPLLIILAYSFATRGANGVAVWAFTLDNYVKLFTTPDFVRIFLRSFWYGILTTILCLLVGYPMALAIVRAQRAVAHPAALSGHDPLLDQLCGPHLRLEGAAQQQRGHQQPAALVRPGTRSP